MDAIKPAREIRERITAEKYESLKGTAFKDAKEYSSSCLYFDTSTDPEQAQLQKHSARFRVLFYEGSIALEFKVGKSGAEKKEVQQSISDADVERLMQGDVPQGVVRDAIEGMGVLGNLRHIGTTSSTSLVKELLSGIGELEKLEYPDGKSVYQLEFRPNNKKNRTRLLARRLFELPPEENQAPSKREELFRHLK